MLRSLTEIREKKSCPGGSLGLNQREVLSVWGETSRKKISTGETLEMARRDKDRQVTHKGKGRA